MSTFIIPSTNIAQLDERFAKLARRAKRIGIVAPSYTMTKEEPKVIKRDGVEKVVLMHHIEVTNPMVKVDGYHFVATIEHTEEGNILHNGKGEMVPTKYRTCTPWCDHCKTLRRRNDTFVVKHEVSDTYMQIGRNCLAEFFGINADTYAAMAEMYYEVDELCEACEGDDSFSSGGGGKHYDLLDKFLSFVAEVITLQGWVSNSMAKDNPGMQSTSNVAQRHIFPSRYDIENNNLLFRIPSDKSLETAKLAIEWCENISDEETEKSEYLHNIRVIAKRGVVEGRQYGYAASIVSGYLRHVNDLKKREFNKENPSQHVGTVGKRQDFTLLVEKVIQIDSNYGSSFIHIMTDSNNNRFVWKASGTCLDTGETVTLKGTIKEHSVYREQNQTVLTRCKVQESK